MFRQTKRRALERKNFGREINRNLTYNDRLNLYQIPPIDEITLDEFEGWAIDRLKILGEIDSSILRNRTVAEIEKIIKPLLEIYLPFNSNHYSGSSSSDRDIQLEHERKKDHYSHFILRLAFCRSQELRTKFIKNESMLFRIRYNMVDRVERMKFVDSLDLDWELVEMDEKEDLREKLVVCSGHEFSEENWSNIKNDSVYKVPFEKVPELVENRRVFIRYGKAYVPANLQVSLIMNEFSTRLERALEMTARAMPRLDEDERIIPILQHLATSSVLSADYGEAGDVNKFNSQKGDIAATEVKKLVRHFPLCMSNLQTHLSLDGHLKYFGRQQYGLFLKGIGLKVDEALKFWRLSFSKIPEDKFQKEYRYNIRHNYGLEGGRKQYRPYDCKSIINQNATPGPGDHHGCPYKHFPIDHLINNLQQMGINDKFDLNQIRDFVEKKSYHIACTKVFELTHKAQLQGKPLAETINHPNQYFGLTLEP
ncbi:DNA primase large subunit [Nadsonia fulvescens var. elongata DSM 6958]|uniref:DNA primase large subunit n=1 Tax=Nadsonia fulvescens var. elongata DSM 6958 TaxID=857566 RepID=A0A1E3PDW7_9ASCO|nr:DNA primase large subunit [Nadsonia fulvescens var. elongata DSM 6958]